MYELFTLGGGTYLIDLLNAVAAITSGGAYITLAQLAGVGGLGWVLFRTAFGGSWKDNAKWMLLFVTVWGAMIVPKATVRVVDRLDPALAPAVVANVPIGLALFASLTSQVGDGLTRLTEQAFTLPDDLAYRRHGLIFGARLAAAATRLEITDTVFARNIRNYARQCVFHALLLGHISADDLRESTDIWSLVTAGGTPSAGASPARMFEFATRQPAGATGATPIDREIVTCQVGAGRLNAQWNAEIARAGTVFGRRIFPGSRTEALARAELLAALPAAHDFLIGASRSAGEIMRQQMVLNAVHDAGEQWAAEAGNAAALSAYTEARAEAQTVSAYRAIGRQAETWVPLLKIVFECLYIGAFPMAVLLMLTPAGTAIFRSYVTGLIWLQSWGPLYAVLHRISMGEAAERMSAVAAMPGGDIGISLVAQAGIRAVGSDVAVMSGYLSMSVPFLAAALAYGLSKATVLATSVLAVGQDAASSAAHEGATGNLSLANTSYDTHRFATLEGRQIRTSAHVDTDRYIGYAPGGAGFTVTGDGTAVADAGSATSRIPAAGVRLSESLATSHEERAADARSMARNWSAEAATARTAAANDATAMVQRYTHDVTAGTAHARGVTESESSQAQELAGHIDKLAEIGGISKNQAAALTGEARIGGSWDFVVKAGADGSAMWRGQTIESDAWNRIKEYDRQHGVTETWSKVADASKRWSTQTGDSEMASLEESLGANLTRMRSYGERASLTGSGKTVLISDLVAQIRARGERCVIYDKMGSYTRSFYDPDRDVLLNPLDARAPRWSPFLEARNPRDFDTMAAALIPQQRDTVDPFWVTAARQLFANGAGVLWERGVTDNKVLVDHLLKTELTKLAEAMEGTVAQSIVDPENPKTALSVRAMLTAHLGALEVLPDTGEPFSIRDWIAREDRAGGVPDNGGSFLFLTSRGDQHASLRGLISTWIEIAVNSLLSLDQADGRRIWIVLDELPTLHQVPSLQPGLAESRQFGGCFVLGIQVVSSLRDLYGRNGAETISGLCGTRVVLAAPDKDTAQWSADSLGRAEIEEVSEGVSYGANTIRDGVSLTPKRELRPLALASEIMQLPNLQGYLKFPGPLPVAGIRLDYVVRPKAAERFVPRKGAPEAAAAAREDATGTDSEAAPAEDAKPETLQGLLPLELPDDIYEPAATTVEDAEIIEPETGPAPDANGSRTAGAGETGGPGVGAATGGADPGTPAEAARSAPVEI